MKFHPDDPFAKADPRDGYRVERVEYDAPDDTCTVTFYVKVVQEGFVFTAAAGEGRVFPADIAAFWQRQCESTADLGDAQRIYLVIDSVCRYFNTGGNWEELTRALATIRAVVTEGLHWQGYELWDSKSTTDGHYEHVYGRTDGSDLAAVWVEDQYVALKKVKRLEEAHDAAGRQHGDLSQLRSQLDPPASGTTDRGDQV